MLDRRSDPLQLYWLSVSPGTYLCATKAQELAEAAVLGARERCIEMQRQVTLATKQQVTLEAQLAKVKLAIGALKLKEILEG